MYDYFVDFCGITPELLETYPELNMTIVMCCMLLACFGLAAICYMLIVIFRGWK